MCTAVYVGCTERPTDPLALAARRKDPLTTLHHLCVHKVFQWIPMQPQMGINDEGEENVEEKTQKQTRIPPAPASTRKEEQKNTNTHTCTQ